MPQAAAETLRTLNALATPGGADPVPLAFLAAAGTDATEYLARAVVANAEAGALAALEARRNPDGRFGGAAGYASDPLDTALALETLVPGRPSYPANSRIEAQVHLANSAAAERQVRLYAAILDASGQAVEQFPAKRVPLGGDPVSALETVPPGGGADAAVEWDNGARAPGRYDLVVQAYDNGSGRLLAERSAPVELLETRAIGGSTLLDPPGVQLAAQTPVSLTAKLANRGNLDLPGGAATATVTLKNPGYQSGNPVTEIQTLAKDNGLNYPRGMDRDSNGNIYVVNYLAGTLSRIDPAGTVSKAARGFSQPVDVAANGDIYVLNLSNLGSG